MFHTTLMPIVLLLLLLCTACRECPDKVPPFTLQEFNGRDETIAYNQRVRRPVYQAKVPLSWQRIDPKEKESLLDTTKPIVSFILDKQILLTVHNFPSDSVDQRIPPAAQIERWKQKTENCRIENTGHGGFAGFYFEGQKENATVYAWSLQLDLDHYQTLRLLAATVEEEEHYRQMAADYTIKVAGPTELIEKHKAEILLFANSFELIQEIPPRL